MSESEPQLLANENIVYKTELHWVIFLLPLFIMTLSLACFQSNLPLREVGILLLVCSLILIASTLITYKYSEFIVTNKRIISRRGLFTRDTMGLLLNKVESVQVNQGIFGRILGFGNINIIGTGGTSDRILNLKSPFAYRKAVLESLTA